MQNFRFLLLRLMLLAAGSAFTVQSISQVSWKNITEIDNRTAVCFGNGIFVSAGEKGRISSSTDGIAWNAVSSGVTDNLIRIVYANGLFVASGEDGVLLTSTNGQDWNIRNSTTTQDLYGVTYGNGTFVVVGDHIVLTSTNGTSWTAIGAIPDEMMLDVAYGNGKFTTVCFSGAVLTSPNATAWTPQTSSTTQFLYSVEYQNSMFTAVGNQGTIITSPDGETWTPRTSGTSLLLCGISYANGLFIVTGANGTLLTSPDATNWAAPALGTTQILYGSAFGNGGFTAVGSGGVTVTSTSGTTWTSHQTGFSITGNVVYGMDHNGQFAALSNQGILYSSNGTSWTLVPTFSNEYVSAFLYNTSGNLIGTTTTGNVLYSSTTSWQSSTNISGQALYDIAYGNGRYVIASNFGALYSSPTGAAWTSTSVPGGLLPTLSTVEYLNGHFVALGTYPSTSVVFSSADGQTWIQNGTVSSHLRGVAFGNGQYVAVSDNGGVYTSADLQTWQSQISGTTQHLRAVCYAYGFFVAVGDGGTLLTSADGVVWQSRDSYTTNTLNCVKAANGSFVVGGNAVLLQSDAINPLPVTLVRFDALKNEGVAMLRWQTSEESNSDRFEIERSTNGTTWFKIGDATAAGNVAGTITHYSFTDNTPLPGVNYYRLKMIDRAADRLDGSYAYSRIVGVQFEADEDVVLYPNPVSNRLHYKGKAAESVTGISVMDASGRMLYGTHHDGKRKEVDMRELPAGMYLIGITTESGVRIVKKVIRE